MALLPILSFPDPRLRTIAKPVEEVTDDIRQLAADMFETMYEAGIGLAATQVDHHIQLIVMDLSEEKNQPMVFINPKVTPLTKRLSRTKKAVSLCLKYTTKLSVRHV
jgi:peptide deformylase